MTSRIKINLVLELPEGLTEKEKKLFLDDLRADLTDMLVQDYKLELNKLSGGVTLE